MIEIRISISFFYRRREGQTCPSMQTTMSQQPRKQPLMLMRLQQRRPQQPQRPHQSPRCPHYHNPSLWQVTPPLPWLHFKAVPCTCLFLRWQLPLLLVSFPRPPWWWPRDPCRPTWQWTCRAWIWICFLLLNPKWWWLLQPPRPWWRWLDPNLPTKVGFTITFIEDSTGTAKNPLLQQLLLLKNLKY